MDHQLLLTLLRRLLDLCRGWARRSLQSLLRIYSALSLRRRASGSSDGDKKAGSQQKPRSSKFADSLHEGHNETTERPIVLACSSTPRKPPPARTYTKHTSIDSYNAGPTCMSPTSTLHDSPGVISPSAYSMSRENSPRGLSSPLESFTAEPACLIAPPPKPIKSILPSLTSRYDRKIAIGNDQGPWIFEPLETFTIYDDLAVPSWTHHVQPEGQLYFCNTSRRFHYLTEAHLCDPRMLAEAELFISVFERKAEHYRNLPTNVEVVLEIDDDHWLYYMVDLDRRCLFWLDNCVVNDAVLPGKFGVEYREHFRHMFDFEFWQHIEYFPNHRPLLKGVLEELVGILVQMHIDVVTSLTSTSAYSDGELQALISSVKQLQVLQTTESATPYVANASARVMAIIANERFFNFAGFHGARLSHNQSVRGDVAKPRSMLMTMLSPILFYAPEVHLSGLEKVWVDSVVKERHWKAFQNKIERDWEGFVLYATVLLNANVAFLSIPSVISDNLAPTLLTSPAAVVSQVSIIASLGSIIVGLLLVRQMRISAKESVEDYLAFLENRNHPQLGLETLAILYGLPYALLMWGMATFLASVAIVCFYDMNGSTTLLTRVIYGAVWLFVIILILWTIVTGWEKKRNVNWRALLPKWCKFFGPSGPSKLDTDSTEGTEETELDTLDVRSVHSRPSARSRFTASSTVASSIGRSWRSRMHQLAERPRRSLRWMSARDAVAPRQSLPHLETGPSS